MSFVCFCANRGKGPVQEKIHNGRQYIDEKFPLTDSFGECQVKRIRPGQAEAAEAGVAANPKVVTDAGTAKQHMQQQQHHLQDSVKERLIRHKSAMTKDALLSGDWRILLGAALLLTIPWIFARSLWGHRKKQSKKCLGYNDPKTSRGSCFQKLQPTAVDMEAGNDRSGFSEAQRQRSIMLQIHLLEHASRCTSKTCPSSNCARMKSILQHGRVCRVKAAGYCLICKRIWTLLRIHAQKCNDDNCAGGLQTLPSAD